jgi:hypothetical protein
VQALSLFHSLRTCGVSMNVQTYYAMIYCLQRLEEESWSLRNKEEVEKAQSVSPSVIDFLVDGCESQLLPESKPWIGRVHFHDTGVVNPHDPGADYDAMGEEWIQRYRSGHPLTFRRQATADTYGRKAGDMASTSSATPQDVPAPEPTTDAGTPPKPKSKPGKLSHKNKPASGKPKP